MEQQPHQHQPEHEAPPEQPTAWHPNEHVGDTYAVEIEVGREPIIRRTGSRTEREPDPAAPSESPESERRPPESPFIYVESLADYNNGYYHGAWIDATREPDDIREKIREMLADSPVLKAEGETFGDWAIHDYEGFGQIRLDEIEDPEFISGLAGCIAHHGDRFLAWAELEGRVELAGLVDSGQLEGRFHEAYLGEADDLNDYGEQLWEEMGWQSLVDSVLPLDIAKHTIVGAHRLAHDLWSSGDISIVQRPDGDGIWIFRADL